MRKTPHDRLDTTMPPPFNDRRPQGAKKERVQVTKNKNVKKQKPGDREDEERREWDETDARAAKAREGANKAVRSADDFLKRLDKAGV